MLKKWIKKRNYKRYNNSLSHYAALSGFTAFRRSLYQKIARAGNRRHTSFTILRSYFLKIGAGACLAGIVLLFFQQPALKLLENMAFFRVEKPIISKNIIVSNEEIEFLADIPATCSIFSLSEHELAARISAHPWIEKAVVKKHFPNEVRIEIKEYHPVALVVTEGDKLAYMDRTGSVFTPAVPGDMLDYPVITGMQGLLEEEKKEVIPDIVTFLKYLDKEDPNFYAQMVSEIHFQGGDQWLIVYVMDFDFPVSLGKGNMRDKYNNLKEIFARAYKPHGNEVPIDDIKAIRMDYSDQKVYIRKKIKSG